MRREEAEFMEGECQVVNSNGRGGGGSNLNAMTLVAGGAFAAALADGGMIEARESPWTKHFSHGIWRELSCYQWSTRY
jgi:hypothetical protein